MKSLIMPTENFKNGKSVNNLDQKRTSYTLYIVLSQHYIYGPKGKKDG